MHKKKGIFTFLSFRPSDAIIPFMKTLQKLIFPLIGAFTIIGMAFCLFLLADARRERAIQEGIPTLEEPSFSMPGGFYDTAFSLTITAPAHCEIRYTTDGSIPTENSMLYESPILVDCEMTVADAIDHWRRTGERSETPNAKVIRAISINSLGEKSEIMSATFFVNAPELQGRSVVSILMNPEDLFGEQGIYDHFEGRGEEWERRINLEFFEHAVTLNQPAGIRIQGASAREYYAKRFSVFSRKDYGTGKTFAQNILGEYPIHAFVLREGFMNAFIQHLVQDRNIASADAKETYVFVNGCFWNVAMLQEKYNSTYFENRYGFQKDNVILAKAGVVESEDVKDQASFQALYDYLRTHDLSDDANYAGFQKLADVQSFIDFSCVNLYFGNMDFNEQKNVYYWRSRKPGKSPYEDGRWRWGLYDLDLENLDYGFYETDINTFSLDTHYAGSAFNTREMYVSLKENRQFCRDFVNTFMDLINTEFRPAHAREIFDAWNCTPAYWRKEENWCESYFPIRNERITEYLAEEFGLSAQPVNIHLRTNDESGGTVTLGTITPALSEAGWDGLYFTDYPLSLTATPAQGYRFVEWKADGVSLSKESTLMLTLSDTGADIEAVFARQE